MATITTYRAKALKPINARILVKGMQFSERISKGGLILPSDDTKSEGIRPRWAEVCAIGPDQKDVKVGEWVLVDHGRWTRGLKINVAGEDMVVRMIDENDILLVSDEPQVDETFSSAVSAKSDRHKIEGSLHNTGVEDF